MGKVCYFRIVLARPARPIPTMATTRKIRQRPNQSKKLHPRKWRLPQPDSSIPRMSRAPWRGFMAARPVFTECSESKRRVSYFAKRGSSLAMHCAYFHRSKAGVVPPHLPAGPKLSITFVRLVSRSSVHCLAVSKLSSTSHSESG
jgi:hypothetical protein